jgi:hypothetical protein
MRRRTFWMYTVIVALCGLSVSAAIGWKRHEQPASRQLTAAAWKEKFQDLDGLAKGVDAIVLARAVATAPGRVAYSADGEDALPFQVVSFEVIRGVKGAKRGDQVQVERAGGAAPDGTVSYFDLDGGDFEAGNTYLLFLKRQEDGPYYYQVNDQGRFQVEGGRLRAVEPGEEVSSRLHGRTVEEGIATLRQNK